MAAPVERLRARAVSTLGLLGVLAAVSTGAPRASAAQAPLRLMSFNIRYGTANDGAHAWPNRRAAVIGTIQDHAPHLLGVQEALRFQLDELVTALDRYREIGVGRDDGRTAGEYAAILVDTLRCTGGIGSRGSRCGCGWPTGRQRIRFGSTTRTEIMKRSPHASGARS